MVAEGERARAHHHQRVSFLFFIGNGSMMRLKRRKENVECASKQQPVSVYYMHREAVLSH
jgi:hypothetical protein